MAYDGKVVMRWSKREGDVVIHYPRKVDGHFTHSVLTEPVRLFLDEMERRGYDRASFRLSIKRVEGE